MDPEEYLKKHYKFKPGNWSFPDQCFRSDKWTIEKFQQKKRELNSVKEKLNKFDLEKWSQHTRSRDPSTYIINTLKSQYRIELLTQAWCKFYECLNQFDLISHEAKVEGELNSIHLCEAPGAFISSLNHYLSSNYPYLSWNWMGNTLNPYYEGNSLNHMVGDDRLIQHTFDNWCFGNDCTGDLMNYSNHQGLVSKAKGKNTTYLAQHISFQHNNIN